MMSLSLPWCWKISISLCWYTQRLESEKSRFPQFEFINCARFPMEQAGSQPLGNHTANLVCFFHKSIRKVKKVAKTVRPPKIGAIQPLSKEFSCHAVMGAVKPLLSIMVMWPWPKKIFGVSTDPPQQQQQSLKQERPWISAGVWQAVVGLSQLPGLFKQTKQNKIFLVLLLLTLSQFLGFLFCCCWFSFNWERAGIFQSHKFLSNP